MMKDVSDVEDTAHMEDCWAQGLTLAPQPRPDHGACVDALVTVSSAAARAAARPPCLTSIGKGRVVNVRLEALRLSL